MEKIRGYVYYIRYPKSGLNYELPIQFAAFNINTNEGKIACAGKVPYIQRGDYLEFSGDWDNSAHTSFTVKMAVRCDDDKNGATSMLGFIFGGKTAVKILEKYKGDACCCWEMFKEHPDVFINDAVKIKGIGIKKINKAYEKWENYSGVDVIFKKYEKYGMTISEALRIYQKWTNKSIEIISKNPYLLREVNINFELMDKIALREYGFPVDNPDRVYTGAVYALKKVEAEGHCYIRLKSDDQASKLPCLKKQVQAMLGLRNTTILDEQLVKLFEQNKLVRKKHRFADVVCFPDMDKAEDFVAKKILGMLHSTVYGEDEIDKFISDFEEKNFKLDILQKSAIKTSVKNQFSIISGPPGAGKTTIIDTIVLMLRHFKPGIKIQMCSPTGKAAQRMRESTGEEASTIHRLLEYKPEDECFSHDENNPLECDVLIIDEFSMCGMRLFNSLLHAVPDSCHVILVGDKDQLPSIEPGKILQDLLSLDFIPKTILTKVYRQAAGSAILEDALAIGREDYDAIKKFKDANDLKFYEIKDVKKLQDAVVERFMSGVKEYGLENVCIMTPTNKGDLGTIVLNEIIQDRINPQPEEYELASGRSKFRLHDKVIQTKNEANLDVFNGDTGTIVDIIHGNHKTGEKDTIVVDFGDSKIIEYNRDRFDRLKLAYSLTIHKLQGSEYPLCIMILHSSHIYQLEKRLIYTGWTRAKKELDIFGEKDLISYAVSHKRPERHSLLIQNFRKLKKD